MEPVTRVQANPRRYRVVQPGRQKSTIAAAVLLAVSAGILYTRLRNATFVNLDDPVYVSANPVTQSGITPSSIRSAFASVAANYWHPITWLSHALDCELFGLDAGLHHITSIIIHAATLLALAILLLALTQKYWPSLAVAWLWAVHPLRVESVAWIAERKDVLSGLFGISTLFAYSRYVAKPTRKRFLGVLGLFALAVMSKPTTVVLPLACLLLDYWPLKRSENWCQLVREKVPLFAMSALVAVITIIGQHEAGAMKFAQNVPLSFRMQNAAVSALMYLAKTFWPVNLACHYPYPKSLNPALVCLGAVVVALLSTTAVMAMRTRPYLFVGWLWFLLWLLPTIGFVQVGRQAYADRFTYWPAIGIIWAIVWLCADFLEEHANLHRPVIAGAVLILGALSVLTYQQTATWMNSVALFTHALRVGGDNDFIRGNLATTLVSEGRLDEAEPHLVAAIMLAPERFEHHFNLANVRLQQGDFERAGDEIKTALRLEPVDPSAHFTAGVILLRQGSYEHAIAEIRQSVHMHFDTAQAASTLNDFGASLAERQRLAEAERLLRVAVEINGSVLRAQKNLTLVLYEQGQIDAARQQLQQALRIAPRSPELREVAAHLH